ncbi:MAG TPA: hypothetical protein VGS19_10610 [Streptosporangiaceae bacterium]|nr:hypothetical protein [Streptosporangiaceae bacterium]
MHRGTAMHVGAMRRRRHTRKHLWGEAGAVAALLTLGLVTASLTGVTRPASAASAPHHPTKCCHGRPGVRSSRAGHAGASQDPDQ